MRLNLIFWPNNEKKNAKKLNFWWTTIL